MKRISTFFLFLLLSFLVQAQTVEFGKKSRIIDWSRTEWSKKASGALQKYLCESSGLSFQIKESESPRPGDIVINELEGLPEDSFHISVKNRAVFLEGSGKALFYAVCDFLEQEVGMDYFGDGEYNLPKVKSVTVKDRLEVPAFRYRQTSHWSLRNGRVAISDNGVDKVKNADEFFRLWYRLEEPHDLFVENLWVHTCNKLLPASRYGLDHPEYYAWFDGARHPGSASQWCLSNRDVLEIVCERIDSLFKANPSQTMISISQNDGSDTYCRCPDCIRIINEEGSPSGPILRFVNAVARRFPDKQISTLAYLFSVKPPLVTKPEPNVSIMLCDIDCRRQTSLPENPSGAEFMGYLEGWSKVCNNIFLWDYGINFDNYLSPFPNFQTIKDNMVIFQNHGVKMHFSQINSSWGGDFAEMRPYLVSKLMWNPGASLDSLERHFAKAYYGAAAPYILRYIYTLEGACVSPDVDLFIYDSPVSYKETMLRPALMRRYNELFDAAEAAVKGDSKRLQRVRRSRLTLQYSALEIARTDPNRDFEEVGKQLALFESRIREFGIETLNERNNSPLEYCKMYRERYLRSEEGNFASGCPITYIKGPHSRYEALSRKSLTDGLFGGTGYVENWVGWEGTDAEFVLDLGVERQVSRIGTDFLRQIGGWVLEPRGVKYYVSPDGENYELFAEVKNPESRDGTIGFRSLEASSSPSAARYVKVFVEGVKVCPEWHYGVGNPCWFFIDEVWVY